ncbi:MAG: class I SAM-dependent methyltransferase [Candidatus Viridilinea halotolerans]|uniref:Class I SAM-dependent methyltransferase n=1 Tax=Candidatus Viridilinea halotolerans TaxID=2491704 RepID=A0A426TZW3_9CHLR|nr:MAG: class I SAM-dependent methyltransferase [Candidatus Viridilinea halotolerans]
MTTPPSERFLSLQRRYQERNLPWDLPLPPPEIESLAATLPPGRALDLGCGVGRTCIHLAAVGWTVDGIDFVPEAIAMARERMAQTPFAAQIRLFNTSVTAMPFLSGPYDLAIDIGCMHALEDNDLTAYAAEVARLVRPNGLYVLFAHLRERAEDVAPVSIPRTTLFNLFLDDFSIERCDEGITTVAENQWNSAWLYLRRQG